MAEVAAAAAVVGRDIGAQQSHGAGFAPDLSAHILLLAPLGLVRGHLRLDESRRRIAENRQIIIDPGRRVVVHLIGRVWRARVPRAGARRPPPAHSTAAVVSRLGEPSWQPLFASSRDDNSAWPTDSPGNDFAISILLRLH